MRVTIPDTLAGMRLDQALARLLPNESRSRLARLIEAGLVLVGGEVAPGKRKMRPGESVDVTLAPREQDSAYDPEAIALEILHEDKDLIAINKPPTMTVRRWPSRRSAMRPPRTGMKYASPV